MAVIADVFDVVLIDSNNEVIGTTTLTEANIEVTVKENDVRGGKGNQLYGVLHSDRDVALNLTDIKFRYEWMAKQLGQNIVTGAGVAYAMPKWYEVEAVSSEKQITLDNIPSDPASVAIYDAAGKKLELTTDFTIAGAVVKLVDVAIAAGDSVEVRTYKYATDPKTESIEIDNAVFAKGVKAILETIEIDEATEDPTHTLQYQFYNALPSGNFSVTTASEKTASTQAFNLRVVKPAKSTTVGKVLRIPYSN